MKSCTILLSYIEHWTPEFIRKHCTGRDAVLCADGGQVIARAAGILPDVVIGDFDSTGSFKPFNCLYITYPVEKDLTDTEACLDYVISEGYQDILLLGGIGGRLDHTLGNLDLLLKYASPDRQIRFLDPFNSVCLLKDSALTLPADPDRRFFSLVPVDREAVGVTVTGAKYDLSEAVLPRASTLGISNEILGREAVVSVRNGSIYVVRSSDHK